MKDDVKLKQDNMFDEYLDSLIGRIDYSNFIDYDKKYIQNMEKVRLIQSKNIIESIIAGLPKNNITYIYTKDIKKYKAPEELDIVDIEIILNSSVLTILKIIKNKNNLKHRLYSDNLLSCDNIKSYNSNHLMIYTTDIYSKELDKLINEKEKVISNLLKHNEPTIDEIDMLNEIQASYYKKYKV